MDLDALRFADFGPLHDAVEDWTTMIQDLNDLKESADKGLKGAARKARWDGYNASVSKEFVFKTAGEFADAHTEATSVRNILRDTCAELEHHQGNLEKAIARGREKNLTVVATGDGGFTVSMNIHPDRTPEGTHVPDHTEKDVTALRDEVQGILDAATQVDDSANEVLQALVDQSRVGFSDAAYRDRDAGARALKEADDLAKLARKDPEHLSIAEFDRLNSGLKKYGHDELFTERFATALGPRGTLEFWKGITDPAGNHNLASHREDRFDDLQRSLSLTLASASQSDTAAMTEWKQNVIDLGDKRIGGNGSDPTGFQVMSNLMRAGDYDDDFLKSYGTRLMETERKLTADGEQNNFAWRHNGAAGTDQFLNRIGDDDGSDPLTGYLKGLSNSPHAATDFLNEEYLPASGEGDDKKAAVSNFQYLFEDRKWPEEVNQHGDEFHTGQNNLALALEAATTGHVAGEIMNPVDSSPHDTGQAKLFESLVASISEDNEQLTTHAYMSDSVGQIASEYLPDLNRAISGESPHGNDNWVSQGEWNRIEKTYPLAGSAAELSHHDVARFLFAVGQSPDGYAAVEVGQKSYMSNLMDHHLDPHLPRDDRPGGAESMVKNVAQQSGEISGYLAQGRNHAISGSAHETDEKYNHAVAQWKNILSGTIGAGVGVGTSFIASPAIGAGIGGAAGTVTSVIMEELFENAEGTAQEDKGTKIGESWEAGQTANMAYTQQAAAEAAKAHGLPKPLDVGSWANDSARRGFLDAGTYMDQFGKDLKKDE
jgi:hypothetical protein